MKAINIKATGEVTEIVPANGTDFSLEELYRYTNCDCVEIIPLSDGRVMVCDDDMIK